MHPNHSNHRDAPSALPPVKKILFVCHGNICRSPMAEFILKHLAEEAGIRDLDIASAATSAEEIGNPVYPPARRTLAEHGISCEGKRARQLRRREHSAAEVHAGIGRLSPADRVFQQQIDKATSCQSWIMPC